MLSLESAAVDLTPNTETSTVSIPPKEEAEEMKFYGGLALAFENFKQNDNLDSFKGLADSVDEAIETARGLLLKEDPLKVSKIKKQFLEYGNCFLKEFKNENVSDDEKVINVNNCLFGDDLLALIADSQSSS